jgi:uncharacterized protein YheU (UPF0270 family)
MAQLLRIPLERVDTDVLQAMLQDYASRDGTDYGERELSLAEKVSNLMRQLDTGSLAIVYDLASEQWDLVPEEKLVEFDL